MKKILFVVDENKIGGVSIVLEDILNNISINNYDITLLILHNNGDRFKNIPKSVKIIYGGSIFDKIDMPLIEAYKSKKLKIITSKLFLLFLMKTKLIKLAIKKERKKLLKETYDIEIAFKYGFTTIFTYYGNTPTKINWVHTDCKMFDPAINYRKYFKKILSKFTYNVLLSSNIEKNFNEIYKCHNTIIINNIVDENRIKKQINNDIKYLNDSKFRLLTVGRLTRAKGYDNLIDALNNLKHLNIELDIIGSGELEEHLKEKALNYKLNNIKFFGKKDAPFENANKYDLFILSSIYEAYPGVIIESFISGIPVLSTDIAASSEMIDSRYGIVCKSTTNDLVNYIKKIYNKEIDISILKNNLKEYKYNNKEIIKKIENILK